jgi:hypothetical protein
VSYLEEAGAVETVCRGAFRARELDGELTATGVLAAENLCNRFLVDCLDMDAGRLGVTLDILSLAELLASLPPGTIEREAVLLPLSAAAAEDMAFFEPAARNRGVNVRVFRSREDALAWLAG